jgi:hypothetical protein
VLLRYDLGPSSGREVRDEKETEAVEVTIKSKAVSDSRMTTPLRHSANHQNTTGCLPRVGNKMPLVDIVEALFAATAFREFCLQWHSLGLARALAHVRFEPQADISSATIRAALRVATSEMPAMWLNRRSPAGGWRHTLRVHAIEQRLEHPVSGLGTDEAHAPIVLSWRTLDAARRKSLRNSFSS